MSARPRRAVTPEMQAWIDEQKKNFTPADMEPAIRLMRQYAREARRASQENVA